MLCRHTPCYGACTGSPMAISLPAARSGGCRGRMGLETSLVTCFCPRSCALPEAAVAILKATLGSRASHSSSSCCPSFQVNKLPKDTPPGLLTVPKDTPPGLLTLPTDTPPGLRLRLRSSLRISFMGISPKTLWWLCNFVTCQCVLSIYNSSISACFQLVPEGLPLELVEVEGRCGRLPAS